MYHRTKLCVFVVAVIALARPVEADDWYVTVEGRPEASGRKDSPCDLQSALSGRKEVRPGDTIWIAGGTYKYPDRKLGTLGYIVKLAGEKRRPIHVRAVPGQRVTIDGGMAVQEPSTWLWLWDLEILVSENFSMPREVKEPGSSPRDYNRPWGGLHVYAGEGCKFINLVIHDNAQGISWWVGSTNSEVYGCIIYDNGWKAPDRGHGHAIYTQNQNGTKTVAECIMTGGYSYTLHAYGSSRAYVDNYLVERNIAYDAGTLLIGGGRPSRNIRVSGNWLFGVPMQIGYAAPENEDCKARDNLIVGAGLQIKNFKQAVQQDNLVLGKNDPRPAQPPARIELRPNRYDPNRATVAVLNWAKTPTVELQGGPFLRPGDEYCLMNPKDFFGQPVLSGRYDGNPIRIPMPGEFAAFVLLRQPAR